MSDVWQQILIVVGTWFITIIAIERVTEFIKDSEMPIMMSIRGWIFSGVERRWWLFPTIHKLITCGWCTCGWVAFGFAFTLPSHNFITAWAASWGLAGFWHSIYELTYRGRVKTIDISLADNRLNVDKQNDINIELD